MTMASVAVGPASLAAPNMLGPKRYHLQQGLNSPNSPSPTPPKAYESLSKGKKSWSVRLGLSRSGGGGGGSQPGSVGARLQEPSTVVRAHAGYSHGGWGTVSGGSVLAQQMIYAEPWLYGTVRGTSSRGPVPAVAHYARHHHHHHHGAPVLLLCSCPDFLSGCIGRDLGSNCRKCGGHRLAGLAIGGTCRVPTTNIRSRPSLAGMLKPSNDDPYDLMRRNRLALEPHRSRARSTSPLRQASQRDPRSQSVVRSSPAKERMGVKIAAVEPLSRSEWFDCGSPSLSCSAPGSTSSDGLRNDDPSQSAECKETLDWSGAKKSSGQQEELMLRSTLGRMVRMGTASVKPRDWQSTSSLSQTKLKEETMSVSSTTTSGDSRKSILECDVNPYQLVLKGQQQSGLSDKVGHDHDNDDDLSDELSDNALEHELLQQQRQQQIPGTGGRRTSSSNLFDSSKVKSIERTPNRSSVAAIGGQRIRLFNESREPSDEEEPATAAPVAAQPNHLQPSITRIPIPKISPKRPPRRLKEAKNVLKSILKRADKSLFSETKRKTVLFNVDNVILAPEKPADICSSLLEISSPQRKTSKSMQLIVGPMKESSPTIEPKIEDVESVISEAPIVPEELHLERPHRFITIPNIKSPKQLSITSLAQERTSNRQLAEAKIVPQVKSTSMPPVEKIKIDKFVPSKKQQLQGQHQLQNRLAQELTSSQPINQTIDKSDTNQEAELAIEAAQPSNAPKDEPEIKESPTIKLIAVDEKEMIDKCEGVNATTKLSLVGATNTCLTRSQSQRSAYRPETSAADVHFVDTMRLSLCRRAKDDDQPQVGRDEAKRKMSFDEARRNLPAVKCESKPDESSTTKKFIEKEGSESREAKEEKQLIEKEIETEEMKRTREPASWSCRPLATESKSLAQLNHQSSANICKITVSPTSEPTPMPVMVHRLQVASSTLPVKGSRGTSIMINSEQQARATDTFISNNKVTISVSGKDSICNPTVICINNPSEVSASIKTSNDQKRTLVILDSYRSNIVIGGKAQESTGLQLENNPDGASLKAQTSLSNPIEIKPVEKAREGQDSPDSSPCWQHIVDTPKLSGSSKEELISKLLEDSLRKARENGEILDESSGEAILKILKQSLLKSCESTRESELGYFRPLSNLNVSRPLDSDLITSNIFLEENAYEVIKEPIYEEIPDEPPPLPLSPPPTEDFLKNRIFFADEYKDSFRELNSGLDQSLSKYYKPLNDSPGQQYLECSYLSKSPDETFGSSSSSNNNKSSSSSMTDKNKLSSKFELLNFIMDSKERTRACNVAMGQEEDEEDEEEADEEDEDDEEDPERDLEALYEQKETSLGDLSSKSSQISNVSDSSEECNIILANSPEALKTRAVDIERTDSGVGSESSQASSGRGGGIGRRWRTGAGASSHSLCNNDLRPDSAIAPVTTALPVSGGASHKPSDAKLCEDCEQRLEPLIIDSDCVYTLVVCRKCNKKRAERKEIVTEIVETEQKYGRDLQIILEEFHRPMLRAGLLTQEQLSAIFLNVEELLEHNQILAEKLKDAVEIAQESGDEDLVTVDFGKIFLESERMLHAFESYCTRQGGASLLLQNLEKEKELLRIFLKVSQMENTVLRRMNLNSFLMVPVQRVTKYPLLLARLLKATPSGKTEMQELKKRLKQAQTNIELHLEHMNAEAKDITSTKLWRRISIIQNGRRSTGEQDMVNIKLRKMAVEVLEWAHEDSRFVLEGRLLVAQPTDNNWRRGRTVKLAPVIAMLVANGKPHTEFLDFTDASLFPRQIGIKEATLLLVKEKLGRYSLLREPLYLDKCIVCCETDLEDYFEIQELSSKETFIFKAEDGVRTKRWCRTLQAHAQTLGAWRRRRGALPNIMICGVARN